LLTFTRFLGRSPDAATAEDLRRFQVRELEQGGRPPKMNTQVSALRFFFGKTLGRLDLAHQLSRVDYPRKLPRVLPMSDVLKVMSAIEACRTAALGGHVARCENPACGHTAIAYNSCVMGKFGIGEFRA
jgi:integrase/recombinase XerD